MKKLIGSLAGAALFAPALLFAATFTNVQFQNGDVTVQGTGGSTVTATFRVVVPANETLEYIQHDVIGDNLGPVDTSVGGELGLQEGTHNVSIQVKLPPNTGTYSLNVQGAGKFGGQRSINGNDNVVGSASFSSALRVVADGSTTVGGSTPAVGSAEWLAALIASIKAALTPAPTTPAPSTKCAELTAKTVGTSYGIYNDANVSLQGYLLSNNPNSIPALKAGSTVPMGFYGNQTANAVAAFKATNSCL